jgi:hypothetical protein
VTSQVRFYRIVEGRMDEFLAAWRDGVVPLRRAAGYRVDGSWVSREESMFAWVVSYDGPLSWEEAERAYYDSPERASLDPDPATFIEDPTTFRMDAVSPDRP